MNIESLKALLNQAEEHNKQGNFDEAAQISHQVLCDVESFLSGADTLSEETIDSVQGLHCIALITLCRTNFFRGDTDTALTLARTALAIAEERNLVALKARALNAIGSVFQIQSDNTNALEYLHKALAMNEELGDEEERSRNLANIGIVYSNLSDYTKALEYYHASMAIDEKLGSNEGVAYMLGNIAMVYYNLSDHAKALEYHQKALEIYEELGNKFGIAGNLHNIGSVYDELGFKSEALEYFHKAMAINEETGNKAWLANNLAGIGSLGGGLEYAQSMEYLHKSLAINEELGSKDVIANNLTNIGWGMFQNKSDYSHAFAYMQRALTLYEEAGSMEGIARNLGNIGVVYSAREFDGYNPLLAEEYLLKSLTMSREIGNKKIEYEAYQWLAELYKNEKRWEEAHNYLEQFIALEKETLSEEAKHKAVLMEQRRQAEEREKQIAITKAATEAKHQATEQLLHNVLPPSIADKMLDGTTLIAEKLPSVSVMFADIVNFTKLSQRITPEELVEGLDRIFSEFDRLAEKHGLEKIKTIGDAYMVVSGAPVQREDHAEAMAHFALEMVEVMKQFHSISTGEEIQLRIGIHSGEVVAGVIGKNKFAYDLWGDAVNTASRMESHGEAGKIHVSEEFRNAVGNEFHFIERGEMEIKGKGMMRTYFLENI
jgi:class 3 adenylate cyclase